MLQWSAYELVFLHNSHTISTFTNCCTNLALLACSCATPITFAFPILPFFCIPNNLFICPDAVGCRASFPVLLHGCCRPGGGVRWGMGIEDRASSCFVSQDLDSYLRNNIYTSVRMCHRLRYRHQAGRRMIRFAGCFFALVHSGLRAGLSRMCAQSCIRYSGLRTLPASHLPDHACLRITGKRLCHLLEFRDMPLYGMCFIHEDRIIPPTNRIHAYYFR